MNKDFLDWIDEEIDSLQNSTIINRKETSKTSSNTNKNSNKEKLSHSKKKEDEPILISDRKEYIPKRFSRFSKKEQQNKRYSNVKNRRNNTFSTPTRQEWEIIWKFISTFPETKFFLPTLRDRYTRFLPIWGNNETGSKNMWMVQYWEDIILVDCWIQFADEDMLGVNYSIPDVSFLTKYKKNIKWLIFTHGHLDHIWALKHIYPALWCPTIYWTRFTIWLIKKQLEEAWVLECAIFVEVDASIWEKIKIWQFKVEFFHVNHSVPDSAWIYIESPSWTRIVHTWDFKIDFTPAIDAPANLDRINEIWTRWISLLLSDSTGSIRKWFSMSEKNVWEELEKIVVNHHKWRLIITIFSSWISRVQQLIDIAEKYWKTIFLSGRSMVENVEVAKELWYLKIPQWIVKKMSTKTTEWVLPHNQIIITTWSQWEEFSALSLMSDWKHNSIEIIKWDTVVFSSSVVPGNEKSVVWIINKLIKLWANVITKDDWEVHTGWHAFQEEQKIMLNLVKPKYFMPVFGDLYFRTLHKNTAMSIWIPEDNILMLENGQIVDFPPNNWDVFKSKIKAPIQEIIIDWNGMWLATSHVIKAREKMMNSWVLVILYKVDRKTKAIFWNIKLETRWLVYIEEVRQIHKIIIRKSKEVYENTIKDIPDIDEKDLLKIIRDDLEKFLLQKIGRDPMIIPIVVEM